MCINTFWTEWRNFILEKIEKLKGLIYFRKLLPLVLTVICTCAAVIAGSNS